MDRRAFFSLGLLGSTSILLKGNSLSSQNNHSGIKSSRKNCFVSTPPMGWNSFDSYGVYLYHEAAMKNIKALAEKFKPYGYNYFVIDGGWYGEFDLVEGTNYPSEKHAEKVNMNEFGIYQPSKTYFPHGFKEILDYGHSLGLKMGIHLMRGIPREAVENNLPIKNSKFTASDIADTNSICSWNHQNFGVNMNKPGAQEYYNSVIEEIASWKFDFVKIDDLTPYPKEIIGFANAIENCEQDMVYSMSPGGGVYKPDMPYYKKANMVRVTKDIWDRKADIDKSFEAWKAFMGYSHEGFWIDLDMIPFGQLKLMSPGEQAQDKTNDLLAGHGFKRWSNLSKAQMRTFITQRALAASPLFIGGDLPSMDDYSMGLLTNKDMINCNQNGQCAHHVYDNKNVEIWVVQKQNYPGNGWFGIFNRNQYTIKKSYSKEQLGLMKFIVEYKLVQNNNDFNLFDVWNNKRINLTDNKIQLEIEADDVCFVRFEEMNE